MGGIYASRQDFVDKFTEIAGYKAGVILSEAELLEIFKDWENLSSILAPSGPGGGRIESVEVEEAVSHLLHHLGNIPSPHIIPIAAELFHKYRRLNKLADYEVMMELWLSLLKTQSMEKNRTKIDPNSFLFQMKKLFGDKGLDMGVELIQGTQAELHRSPWGSVRTVEWQDEIELEALFKSANLETHHGRFLDQRYIDYLSQNFDDVDRMHWRKFEGLTAEFFDREGYHVALGPGTNDGGVDLRVYPTKPDANTTPMVLVQCKRQKAKIEKALVKSVYADVAYEKAASGLIVTTSFLAPGAEAVRTARGYPVETADRKTLRSWLDKLRS